MDDVLSSRRPGDGGHGKADARRTEALFGLSEGEDADLRRLTVLMAMGQLAPSVVARYEDLRDRDRRAKVRSITVSNSHFVPAPRESD
jgi:hypothetical protein